VKRRHISLLLVLVVLGLAAVAGCGGDDDDSASATTTEETTTEEATTEETTTEETTTEEAGGGTLQGSVGPGFDISISGADNLSPGAYTLVVNDQASSHNFHLTGPGGIDVATDVGAEGEETFEVELVAGEYEFVCDPHASQMNGSFTVG
jgi:plastocyanin